MPSPAPRIFRAATLAAGLLALLLLAGCATNQPAIMEKRWMLEYQPPQVKPGPKLDHVLEARRFSSTLAFRSPDMVYRPQDNQLASYPYNRWWEVPSDMVGDMLRRDLRASGLFRGVLGQEQRGQPRFVVEGGLEQCLELDLPSGWQARLTYSVSVLDINQRQLPQRVLMQKTYSAEEPIENKGAAGLARAMSKAARRLSAQAMKDIYLAVKDAPEVPPDQKP